MGSISGIERTFGPTLPGENACGLLLQPSPSLLGPRGILGDSAHHGPIVLALLNISLHIVGKCNLWQSSAGALGSRVPKGDICSFLCRQYGLTSEEKRVKLRHSLLGQSLMLVSERTMGVVAGRVD